MILSRIVALVTGGASGLGKATVEKLAKENCKVVLADLPTSLGQEVADSIGENVTFTPMDVRSEQEVQNTVNLIRDKFKQLDVVVNCASLSCAHEIYNFNKDRPHQVNTFVDIIESKVVGSFNTIRLGCALIADKEVKNENEERGVIINVAGLSAYDAQIGQTALAAADGGIAAMTTPLCRELGRRGIRVNTIAPGLFRTPLTELIPPKVKQNLSRMTPFPRRLGEPEEFAELVWHIVKNPMINGEVIRLDGGLRLYLV